VRTEVYIDQQDFDKNKALFDTLHAQAGETEEEYGTHLEWERLDGKRACRIAVYRDGSIEDSDSELEEIHNWHVENLLKVKEVFTSRIKSIMNEQKT